MEHSSAIMEFAMPLLLAIIAVLIACICWELRRHLSRNDDDHDEFRKDLRSQDNRIARVETRVERLDADLGRFLE